MADNAGKRKKPKRGRPKTGEQLERRRRVLDAAYAELAEHGYEHVTMLAIAKRAGASKETLYSWYGNRQGLFSAMIEENGEEAAIQVRAALKTDTDPHKTLTGFAIGLLSLLTGDRAVALNRAAMSSPDLAEVLLASGRHRVGPLVEEYLQRIADQGHLKIAEPPRAFTLLYGLIVQDSQIRVLLGEPPPSKAAVKAQAAEAVDRFFELMAPKS